MSLYLAEFNIGTLKYDWDDPRIAEFADNLDRVYGVAERSPGFVWRLSDDDMEAAQLDPDGPLGGDPRTASTLSVWRDLASLEHFVWNTVHKQFYDRRHLWYGAGQPLRLVLWQVPAGHHPDMTEAMDRYRHLQQKGDTPTAFGWDYARCALTRA